MKIKIITNMNKRPVTLFMVFLLFFGGIKAQDYVPAIQIQASQVAEAMVKADFNKIIDFTYPDIVNMAGGRESLRSALEKQTEQLKAQEIIFQRIDIGMPGDVVSVENELHCLVPQVIVLKVDGGTLTTQGHLLGISKDEGKNWYFIDAAQINNENVEAIVPHFSKTLEIPKPIAPVFERG